MQWTARRIRRCSLVMLILALGFPMATAQAQDQTAADLLNQSLDLIEEGQYAQAQQTLQRIDPVQLSDIQQDDLEYARLLVSRALRAQQTLTQADAALRVGNNEQAMQLYREVAEDDNAPDALRQRARAAVENMTAQAGPATEVVQEDADGEEDDLPPPPPAPAPDPTPAEAADDADADDGNDDETGRGRVTGAPEPSVDEQIMSQARALVAQELVVKGRRAMNQNQPNRAASLFEQALQIDPDSVPAQEGLARAQTAEAQMRTDLGDWPGNLPEVMSIERQRVEAIHKRRMTEARNALQAGNYEKARQAALLARSVVDDNRNLFDEQQWSTLRQDAMDLASTVNQRAEAQQVQQLREEQEEAREQAEDAREQAEREAQDKIHRLLERAKELSRQRRYDRALEQLEQVLFIDPRNVSAQFMRDLIQEQKIQLQWHELRRERSREIAKHAVANMEQTIPKSDLITYPPDWPQLTRMRLGQVGHGVESEPNRLAREKLREPISIEFNGNELATVLDFLRKVTGTEIIAQWRKLEEVGITRDTPITIRLSNVPAEKALELILQDLSDDLFSLDFVVDEGVIIIATETFLAEQKSELRTYDISDLLVEIPDFDDAPEFDLNQTIGDNDGGGGDIFSGVDDTGDDADTLDSTAVEELLRNSVAPGDWQQHGGQFFSMRTLNTTLIVRTTDKYHREIVSLLSMLREQRALQIAVESRFLFVTQNFLEAVGMDVDLTISAGDSDVLADDLTIQQNTIESASPPGTTVDGSLGGEDFVPSLAFGAATDSGVGSIGFLLDDLRVDVLVRATQQNVRNIIVNTPRVTFFNGQRAYVNVARQVAFISDLEPTVGDNSSALSPEIDTVSDGVILDVQGTISADRRYVTLTVRPSLSQIIALRRFDDIAAGGGDDDDDDDDGGGGGEDDDDDGGIVGGAAEFLFGSGGSGGGDSDSNNRTRQHRAQRLRRRLRLHPGPRNLPHHHPNLRQHPRQGHAPHRRPTPRRRSRGSVRRPHPLQNPRHQPIVHQPLQGPR